MGWFGTTGPKGSAHTLAEHPQWWHSCCLAPSGPLVSSAVAGPKRECSMQGVVGPARPPSVRCQISSWPFALCWLFACVLARLELPGPKIEPLGLFPLNICALAPASCLCTSGTRRPAGLFAGEQPNEIGQVSTWMGLERSLGSLPLKAAFGSLSKTKAFSLSAWSDGVSRHQHVRGKQVGRLPLRHPWLVDASLKPGWGRCPTQRQPS